jgi:hypothetical protein
MFCRLLLGLLIVFIFLIVIQYFTETKIELDVRNVSDDKIRWILPLGPPKNWVLKNRVEDNEVEVQKCPLNDVIMPRENMTSGNVYNTKAYMNSMLSQEKEAM